MNNLLYFLLFGIGLLFIIKGSDWFLDAIIWIARTFRIPNFIIGATLVSICTTLPEFFVSVGSAISGDPSMSFGNAMGSVACNTGLILGTVILFSQAETNNSKALKLKSLAIPLGILIYAGAGILFGGFSLPEGIFFTSLFIGYLIFSYGEAKKNRCAKNKYNETKNTGKEIVKNMVLFVVGLSLTILGAKLMIEYGVKIAEILNVPSVVIGLTMTALGTSLPELITALTAIRKKASSISIGNIFGANIMNLTLVLGTSSLITKIPATGNIIKFHMPAIFLITVTAALGMIFYKKKLPKYFGILLILMYITYITATTLIK